MKDDRPSTKTQYTHSVPLLQDFFLISTDITLFIEGVRWEMFLAMLSSMGVEDLKIGRGDFVRLPVR